MLSANLADWPWYHHHCAQPLKLFNMQTSYQSPIGCGKTSVGQGKKLRQPLQDLSELVKSWSRVGQELVDLYLLRLERQLSAL